MPCTVPSVGQPPNAQRIRYTSWKFRRCGRQWDSRCLIMSHHRARRLAGVISTNEKIKEWRHKLRSCSDINLPYHLKVDRKKTRGRLKLRWIDIINANLRSIKTSTEYALDRTEWDWLILEAGKRWEDKEGGGRGGGEEGEEEEENGKKKKKKKKSAMSSYFCLS